MVRASHARSTDGLHPRRHLLGFTSPRSLDELQKSLCQTVKYEGEAAVFLVVVVIISSLSVRV